MNLASLTLNFADGSNATINLTPEKPTLIVGDIRQNPGESSLVDYSVGALCPATDRVRVDESYDLAEWGQCGSLGANQMTSAGFSPGSNFYLRATAIGVTGTETEGDVMQVSTAE